MAASLMFAVTISDISDIAAASAAAHVMTLH